MAELGAARAAVVVGTPAAPPPVPAAVQSALRDLGLSERHARALLRLEDGQLQLALAAQAAEKGLSVKQLEALVAARLSPAKARSTPSPAVRDNRIVINALMDTVRRLSRIGIPVASRVEEGEDCVNVIVTIPSVATQLKA